MTLVISIFFQNSYKTLSLSLDKYSETIRKSKSVVNLSSRNVPYLRVLAGRAMEAIASKTLLIEEKNESISKLFKTGLKRPFISRPRSCNTYLSRALLA